MIIILRLFKKLRSLFFKRHTSDREIENFIKKHGSLTPKRFSYTQVKRMICSFREKLGEGGFGAVYKGKLPDGTLVAVKLLNASKGNGEEFVNEVASISRTSHVNIVTLVGFCFEGHKRALIYEYMSNGSLDRFINDENATMRSPRLGWNKLYQIAVGTARGLEYLHRGCSTRILHFDIKPQIILLDNDYCAKISDFGLSKLCLKRESIVSMLVGRGTIGYIAPEVFNRNFGDVSHKSDVYSYGMMLIEMIGGGKRVNAEADQSSEMYFADQVYQFIEEGYDQGFYCHLMEEDKETEKKMAFVGVWCIQTDPKQRPSMRRVIEMLEGSAEALQIPPKPYLFSPRRSPT
ncbi:PR5-like receptor kinase [Punica granatum]|uniref:PR5-like receptor kinase n=1 Tax=Punica granatum TaxID=22663 RepID=A0A6P8EC22_PUNGR|nr:PR5-like receptor kinase [Punica granatum]